jgi:hypothetical protein
MVLSQGCWGLLVEMIGGKASLRSPDLHDPARVAEESARASRTMPKSGPRRFLGCFVARGTTGISDGGGGGGVRG